MKQIEGTIVKVTEKFIVLMCSADGTFKNIPRLQGQVPLIGEKFIYKNTRTFFVSNRSWTKYASIACVLIIMISVFSVFRPGKAEAAYMVALDVNPSVEVYADKELHVISMKALNQDGKKIIQKIEYNDKKVLDVLDSFINQCVEQHYIKPNEKALVKTTIVQLQQKKHPVEMILNKDEIEKVILQSLKVNGVTADVQISVTNEDILQEAHDLNISVNKYEVYKKLITQGYAITLDEVKEQSIKNLEEHQQKSSNDDFPIDAQAADGNQAETSSSPNLSSSSDMNSVNNDTGGFNSDQNHPAVTDNPTDMNNSNVLTDPSNSADVTFPPENTPEVTPEVTPESTPEVTPEITPESTPSSTTESTPEITPDSMPAITPEITPVSSVGSIPDNTPSTPTPSSSAHHTIT